MPAFVAVLRGPDHVFEVANPAYQKLIQHRDATGRPVREVLPEVERQGFIELLDRVYRTGEAYVGTEQRIMLQPEPGAPPEERYLNFVYQPNTTGDGEVIGIIVHGVDVTEQVRARRTAESQAGELQKQATQLEAARASLAAANRRLAAANLEAEEARARLEAVIEQMPSGLVIADAADNRLILANRQVEEIWRQPPPGPNDPGWERFVAFHADGTPYAPGEWPLDRALRGISTMNEEMQIVRADGTRGTISVSSAPIRNRDGAVVAGVAIFDDVTERSRHEDEQAFLVEAARILASSLDYEETLTSVARLAVPRIADWCAVDIVADGVSQRLAVVHADPEKEKLAAEAAIRWPTDANASAGVVNVLRTGEPEIYPEITDEILRAAARDEDHLETLRVIGMRSGMIVPMVARGRTLGAITLISAESGRRYEPGDLRVAEKLASRAAMAIDNALLFRQAERSRDEAEVAQRRAEEARRVAEAANRAKSEFLANMSHEMRTPLNAVTGYAELLEMGIGGPLTEQQKEHLARIRRSTDHLLALINDLLDLARIESGRLEVGHAPGRAVDAVQAALTLLGPQAAERRLELTSDCSGGDAVYVGDRDRVRQIVVNLIGNAVKFTPAGGRVTVSCGRAHDRVPASLAEEKGPWTFIRVEDTGVGIDPEQIERIFRPFEQVQGGYTREAGGAGLGLSISRQLALLMGGELTGESVPREGSAFTLWLPAEAAAESVEVESLPPERARGLAVVGGALMSVVDRVLEAYMGRLKSDPLLPRASELAEGEIQDHHSSLLSDFAAALIAMGDPGESQVRLLQDGGEIQRLVADLHGRQRAQLGWSEEALRREFEIWEEELLRILQESPQLRANETLLQSASTVIRQLVERARRISLRSFRAAAVGTGARPGAPP